MTARISSWARSNEALGGNRPSRPATRYVRVDRDLRAAEGEDQHAGRRLSSYARQRGEELECLLPRGTLQPAQIEVVVRLSQRLLDSRGLLRRQAARADRLLDLLERRVADRLPGREAIPQARVSDIPVGVSGVLGQNRSHELLDRPAMRLLSGAPVELAQAIANRTHPALRWTLPLLDCHPSEDMVADLDRGSHGRRRRRPGFYRRIGGDGPPAVFVHESHPLRGLAPVPAPHRRTRRRPRPAGLGSVGATRSAALRRRVDGRLASFFERFMNALEIGAHRLVVHDWGALALIPAQRDPGRVRRIVILNAVPLLPGYRWHWIARLWRRRWVGEAFNATTSRAATALLLRQARADRGPMPPEFVDMIWSRFDRGTRRAILALYRSAPEYALAAAGRDLGSLACPARRLGSSRSLPPGGVRGRLRGSAAERRAPRLADAGHWPWVERPDRRAGGRVHRRRLKRGRLTPPRPESGPTERRKRRHYNPQHPRAPPDPDHRSPASQGLGRSAVAVRPLPVRLPGLSARAWARRWQGRRGDGERAERDRPRALARHVLRARPSRACSITSG